MPEFGISPFVLVRYGRPRSKRNIIKTMYKKASNRAFLVAAELALHPQLKTTAVKQHIL